MSTAKAEAVLLGTLTIVGLYLSSRYDYLLFHTLAELFSIVIGCGMFVIVWNCRRFIQSSCLVLLGIAFLFVSVLDLAHALAYSGMRVLPGFGANEATQLWVGARFLESVSFLAVPLMLHRHVRAEQLLPGYALVTLVLLLSVFAWPLFPVCYVEGSGLTGFKIISEYVVVVILLVSIALMAKQRQSFDPKVLQCLLWAMLVTVGSELAFTYYVNVYGFSNLLGHYLKILAFYLIYKAIIEKGLSQPYALLLREARFAQEELARSNEHLESLVAERTARLQELVEELEQYSYSIMHDMRAPLRAMTGFAKLMNESCAACPQVEPKDLMRRISVAAGRMDALVTDALNYNEALRSSLPLKPVDAGALLRGMLDSYPEFQSASADIRVEGPFPLVLGNESGLTQCFSNLLGNAVKFVAPGQRPQVRVWAELRDGWVRVWVEDKGIGVPKSMMPRIFQMFARGHHGYEGTGIGLALVRKVVDRMGGLVGVESEVGRGSRFWFELKRADAPSPAAPARELIRAA